MTRADVDYYELLGVDHGASTDEIRSAYRSAIHLVHPDLAGNAGSALSKALNLAYETLSDPTKRAAYDADLLEANAAEATREAAREAPEPPPTWDTDSEWATTDEWDTEWVEAAPGPDPGTTTSETSPSQTPMPQRAPHRFVTSARRVFSTFLTFVLVLSITGVIFLSIAVTVSVLTGDVTPGTHPTTGITWLDACFLGVDLVVVASCLRRKWAQEITVVAGIALLLWLSKVQPPKMGGLTVVPAGAPWVIGVVAWVSVALLTQHRRPR